MVEDCRASQPGLLCMEVGPICRLQVEEAEAVSLGPAGAVEVPAVARPALALQEVVLEALRDPP